MGNILNKESVAMLRARAAEAYLDEINEAFDDARFEGLINELSLNNAESETVRSFLLRGAIERLSMIVLDATGYRAKNNHASDQSEYMKEEEQGVIDLIKKELTVRARSILGEDFDEATKGE